MKPKLLYTIILLLNFTTSVVYSQDYYWYKGAKIYLTIGNKEYIVYESYADSPSNVTELLYEEDIVASNQQMLKMGIIAKGTNLDIGRIVYRITSYISNEDSTDVFITDKFYVKLKHPDDIQQLQQMAITYNVEILYNHTLARWYILGCTANTEYTALQMANIFYESGMFEACEPEFIGLEQPTCANDTYFESQWNLSNTGQYGSSYTGVDINYCDAHSITSGNENTVIAVFDWGVELSHPDLNIYPLSYDVKSRTSPSQIYDSNHGTACAGIIGAISNNNLGVAGIASSCPIMSISMSGGDTRTNMADAFRFAADNGCSVISCSWSSENPSTILDDGISYALANGRNGLGCVVVFSAGNNNVDTINYPAKSNPSFIVVGAISPCGERKSEISCDGENYWGSQFGPELDIMAPGVLIPTTDTITIDGYHSVDYKMRFHGTSSACPHVAAIAGLILSVNPNLTMKEVSDIIESTAQKVGEYDYTITEGRPNGTWNDSVGYGLVDAYAAVLAAKTKYIQNHTYQSGSVIVETYPEIIAGYAVTDNKPYGNVTLEAGSDVTFSATEQVVLKPGFHAKVGSNLHIKIEAPTANIASAPQRIAANTSSEDTDSTNERVTNNGLENAENEVIISTSIYTVSGQLIQTITGGQHDATHLPNGMYILQHRMSDGSVRCEKIANNK
ncbi:MAG: S8 family peptidase [Paludibacteraceae bacterium]|nr:S8 family peptidase [Paludibacteraceae bacterium]